MWAAFVTNRQFPNCLILTGPMGSGLRNNTLRLLHAVRGTSGGESQVDLIYLDESAKSITVEAIRDLLPQVQYGPSHYPTMWVVIPQADRMTAQAGNALLKLMEEPPAGVHFLLTTYRPWLLLPTIRSRSILRYLPKQPEASPSWTQRMQTELAHSPEIDWMSYTDFQKLSLVEALSLGEKLAASKADVKLLFCSWIDSLLTGDALGQSTQFHLQSLLNCVVQLDYNVNLRLQLDALFITLKSSRMA